VLLAVYVSNFFFNIPADEKCVYPAKVVFHRQFFTKYDTLDCLFFNYTRYFICDIHKFAEDTLI